jgi:hypothetical protein
MGVEAQIAAAGLSMLSARNQRSVYEMEAQGYADQAEMSKIQSAQQENQRITQLRHQLASLNSSMSAQGVALGTSASVSALEDDEKKIASSDIASIKLMGMSQRRKFGISESASKAGGQGAMIGGFAKSAIMLKDIG